MPRLLPSLLLLGGFALPLPAADWLHWRGPEMTGEAKETLPDSFDPLGKVGTGNLLWKTPVNGRSAPLVMDGKLYTFNSFDAGKITEGERVTCLDAATGKVLWHHPVNVYHAEVVTSRLGWTTLAADPGQEARVRVHHRRRAPVPGRRRQGGVAAARGGGVRPVHRVRGPHSARRCSTAGW